MTVRISAQQSTKQQAAAAGWLFDHVVERGDRIAIVAESSAAYLAVALGALRTGIIPVLIPPNLPEADQEAMIAVADVMVVLRGESDLEQVVEWPGARRSELSPVPLGRPMHYTSGRTGVPRAISTGVLSEAHGRALLMDDSELWKFEATDIHLLVEPLHRSTAMQFAVGTLLAGGDVVIPGTFDVSTVRAAIKQYRPTTAFISPPNMAALFGNPGDLPSLTSFRLFVHGETPCPDDVRGEAARWLPRGSLWEVYSAVEGLFTACTFEEWTSRPGTVGRARRGRKLSVDAESGQIWCKTPPHGAFEYWGDPERTAAAWRDKAFTVGDGGRLDADGYLYVAVAGRPDPVPESTIVANLPTAGELDPWAPPVAGTAVGFLTEHVIDG